GEPDWVNLLETEAPWVMGDRVWSSTPKRMRFELRKGEDRLDLIVHRGGAPTCRSVSSRFEVAAPESTPVSLRVEMTPGQGSPIVNVVPANSNILRGG